MNTMPYAGVSDRVKAVISDSIIVFLLLLITTYVFSIIEQVPDRARILAFTIIVVLYDPICTSVLGGTLGQLMQGIRVRRENKPDKNILFPLAVLRFFIKVSLGWISLFTVTGNAKGKALHDILLGTIVIYKAKKEQ
jgi:uncharacterized RDD family membrane protein YckC